IAVGDDDQNIYEFRGASSKYLEQFMADMKATKHELIENYRSKNNLVEFTNGFVKRISHRLKETPIAAKQPGSGNIKLVHYQNGNLISPLVQDILSTELAGSICVLTKTNDEALQITGLLLKNGMQAKLIQSNDGFNLQNLLEVRFLLNEINMDDDVKIINEEVWAIAKSELRKKFQQSSKLEVCNNLIKQFEDCNSKKKYKSDLEVFVRESKLEDFYNESGETIFVSTIHKAKGKEFDNVFIMLETFNPTTDEAKRQLYVAMTRAKRNLTIHLNGNYLDNLTAENLERAEDNDEHLPPSQLTMHLTHEDVNLGYFEFIQHRLSSMMSGDLLTKTGEGYAKANGDLVLKLSKKFIEVLNKQERNGYNLKVVKVNFVIYWKKPHEKEIKIILPELYFEKSNIITNA
ncbi:MAG: 3'-5' exonuclease, partial [Ginsengibacter sp.]